MKDYYQVLGISQNATEADIKSAYRKKALEFHPDRNKSPDATEKFKEVTKAYETLSDPQKKQMYDQIGHQAYESGGNRAGGQGGWGGQGGPFSYTYQSGAGDDFDPFDIFEQFFGGASPFGRGQTRQRRSIYEMELSFDEAMKGVEKTTVIQGKEKKIKIPAGVDTGMRIRFSDFDVQVRVKPHQFFQRQGQDLYIEKTISFSEAVLGTVLEVPTIDGNVKIKVRPGTQSGTHVRLREQGVPYPNSTQRGDQYVIMKIHVPEKISGTAKKLLEQLDKEI